MAINISTSAGVFAWQPAAWLRVGGDDAANFLQGQFTNDLRTLVPGGAVYGLWLTLKGKVLADSFVLRGVPAGEFWIGSYFSAAATIRERLESHVIADDVTIVDETASWSGLSLLGVDLEDASRGAVNGAAFFFRGRRERTGSLECVFRSSDGPPSRVADSVGARLDRAVIERRRIAAGIPAIPVDVGPGDLPNEAALEADAISYTKGCYLGQEVMARLKSMGQVRRRLLRVAGSGECQETLPVPLFVGARQVGELRSAVHDDAGNWIGLAMLSLLHVRGGVALGFAADAPPTVRLVEAP